jgi:hypothetical protein
LFGRDLDQLAGVAEMEAKWNFPAEVATMGFLVDLDLADALSDSIALGLGEGGGDR